MRAPVATLLSVVLLSLGGCRCSPGPLTPATSALAWSPKDVAFPLTWTGGARALSVSVDNTGRASGHVSLSVEAPFSVEPTEADVPGGGTFVFTVHFAPVTAGSFEVPLSGASGVTLHAEAAAAFSCAPRDCHHETFDPLQGLCVETEAPDGEACQPTLTCFLDGQCQRGQCVGSRTACDDGDPCTADGCGETGCVHLDATLDCPWSANPCEAPVCTPGVGCSVTAVPDGTACGPRDCISAQVCLSGACVQRPAPQTQGCTDLVYGEPNSCTIADGTGPDARVSQGFANHGLGLGVAPDGTAFFTNGFAVRAVTGQTARTIAGAPYESGHVDGFGSTVRFEGPSDLVRDANGRLLVADFHTIRRVTPGGLVDTLAGAPGVFEQRDGVGAQARFGDLHGLTLGPDGALYVADGAYKFILVDGGTPTATRPTVRRVTRLGEVSTVWVGPELIALADLVWVDGQLRATGGTTASSTAYPTGFWGLLSLEADGGVTVISGSCADFNGRVEASGDGVLCSGGGDLRQTHADGGFDIVTSFGTVGYAGPRALALAPDGAAWTIAQSSGCGLWRVTDAGAQSILGTRSQRQTFLEPWKVVQGPAGAPWFTTASDAFVREVLPDGGPWVVASHDPRSGGFINLSSQSGHVFANDPTGRVSNLVAQPDGGALFCQCPTGGRLVMVGETAVCATEATGLGVCSTDGGASLLFARSNGPADGAPGVGTIGRSVLGLARSESGGVLVASGNRLREVDPSWNLSTLASVDGGTMVAVARVGSTIFVADSQSNEYANTNLVRAYAGGQFTTLAQLSDPILDLVAEDAGTLLIVVPGAIVRMRP
jgi:hypothetical protein